MDAAPVWSSCRSHHPLNPLCHPPGAFCLLLLFQRPVWTILHTIAIMKTDVYWQLKHISVILIDSSSRSLAFAVVWHRSGRTDGWTAGRLDGDTHIISSAVLFDIYRQTGVKWVCVCTQMCVFVCPGPQSPRGRRNRTCQLLFWSGCYRDFSRRATAYASA